MISVAKTTMVEVDIDIDLDEVAEQLDAKTLGELIDACRKRFAFDFNQADPHSDLVERAYRDALRMGKELPQSIRDLLWRVHGRAIA